MKLLTTLTAMALVLSGCGATGTSVSINDTFEYPFHLYTDGYAPLNNVKDLDADIWGTIIVHFDGEITGSGTISYGDIGDCAWEPPYPENQDPPYCELTGTKDGSFEITGTVVQWADGSSPLDAAIDETAVLLGYSGFEQAPREIGVQFLLEGDIPMEIMNAWGYKDGSIKEIETGALGLTLEAAGVFDPFQVSPIITTGNESDQITGAGTHAFEGETQVGQASGTLFFVSELPE